MIWELLKFLGLDNDIDKVIPQRGKDTARRSAVFSCYGKRKLMVSIAASQTQIFYLKRAVEGRLTALDLFGEQYVDSPICYGEYCGLYYVVDPLIDKPQLSTDMAPVILLEKMYSKCSIEVRVEEALPKIEEEFLKSFPDRYVSSIRNLDSFKNYFSELKKIEKMFVCFEHGDYTANNILSVDDGIKIIDFEFYRMYQPIYFDKFDYVNSIEQNVREKLKKLYNLKLRLIDDANGLIDKNEIPVITTYKSAPPSMTQTTLSDFIFNRPDLLGRNNYVAFSLASPNGNHLIFGEIEGDVIKLGVRMVPILPRDFSYLIEWIFKNFPKINHIELKHSLNKYTPMTYKRGIESNLTQLDHWSVKLPLNENELLDRLSRKGKYNFKREYRLLVEHVGEITFEEYERNNIPTEIVREYFAKKEENMGTDYGRTESEYLDTFFITNAYAMRSTAGVLSILFSCEQTNTVFLENLTYDKNYSDYSVGFILYTHFLCKLIEKEKKVVYLGGGNQLFKKRFDAAHDIVYSGLINRKEKSFKKRVKSFLKERINAIR